MYRARMASEVSDVVGMSIHPSIAIITELMWLFVPSFPLDSQTLYIYQFSHRPTKEDLSLLTSSILQSCQ